MFIRQNFYKLSSSHGCMVFACGQGHYPAVWYSSGFQKCCKSTTSALCPSHEWGHRNIPSGLSQRGMVAWHLFHFKWHRQLSKLLGALLIWKRVHAGHQIVASTDFDWAPFDLTRCYFHQRRILASRALARECSSLHNSLFALSYLLSIVVSFMSWGFLSA